MLDDEDKSIVHGVNPAARCLVALASDQDHSSFLVASASVATENEIHLIHADEDTRVIQSTKYWHPYQTWDMAAHPGAQNSDLFLTCHNTPRDETMKASLWRLPSSQTDGKPSPATQVIEIAQIYGTCDRIVWDPHSNGKQSQGAVLSNDIISLFTPDLTALSKTNPLSASTSTSTQNSQRSNANVPILSLRSACMIPSDPNIDYRETGPLVWNPHQPSEIFTSVNSNLYGFDLRDKGLVPTVCIENAHHLFVRDISCNVNKPYFLATGGDDCQVKVWDTRKTKTPVVTIGHHTHWVWRVAYNPFHDQLLMSSGSDGRVNLYNISSVSSLSPSGAAAETVSNVTHETTTPDAHSHIGTDGIDDHEVAVAARLGPDGLLKTYDQHEESVYAAAWSTADPWMFASVSYDGRVSINFVPRQTKFNIIL